MIRNQCELDFRALDVVRWEKFSLDAAALSHQDEVLDQFQGWIADELLKIGNRTLVVRVEVTGPTHLQYGIAKGASGNAGFPTIHFSECGWRAALAGKLKNSYD